LRFARRQPESTRDRLAPRVVEIAGADEGAVRRALAEVVRADELNLTCVCVAPNIRVFQVEARVRSLPGALGSSSQGACIRR
jgi:hypothetical protein